MSEQNILDTPLNSPNAEMIIPPIDQVEFGTAPLNPVPTDTLDTFITTPGSDAMEIDPLSQATMGKSAGLQEAVVDKQNRLAEKSYLLTGIRPITEADNPVYYDSRDTAVEMSVDQAQKMVGAGLRTVGSSLNGRSVEEWGQSIIDQQDQDMKLGGYHSEYGGRSVRQTFNEDGVGTAIGRIWEMMQENVATSGVALVGAGAAALTAPFSATAATILGGATMATTTAMGIGEAALEMEDKGVEVSNAKAIGTGILISLLDRFGASKVIPSNLLPRMTGDQIVGQLVKKGHIDAAKAVAKSILAKSGAEAGTEILQESLIMGTAASQGAQYTQEEVVDRFIDVAFVAAGMSATPATVTSVFNGSVEAVKTGKEVVGKAAGEALSKVQEGMLDKRSDPDSSVFKAVKFSQENAENIQGTVEEANKYGDTLSDMIGVAAKEIEDGTTVPSKELLTDFAMLQDIQQKVGESINARLELGEELDMDQLAIEVEATVKKGVLAGLTPEKLAKLKGGVLYSMQVDDSITEEQAKVFIREGGLTIAERTVAVEYIKRIKSISEVNTDVIEGVGSVFVGAKTHARSVHAAMLGGKVEAAKKSLAKFQNFANYMSTKSTTFKAVWQFNSDLKNGKVRTPPKGIEIVSQDDTGKITEFKILDIAKFGITADGAAKVWDSSKDGAIRTLGRQVEKESAVIASYLAQATQAVNGVPVQDVQEGADSNTEMSDQEAYYASLDDSTGTVTEADMSDFGLTVEPPPPTTEEDSEPAPWNTDEYSAIEETTTETAATEEVAAAVPELDVTELVNNDPEANRLTNMIAGMKKSQSSAKNPETYDKRIAALELELQTIVDAIEAKEAARLADPKTDLEVYDFSKTLSKDETVEAEYVAEVYGEGATVTFLGSSIWGEDTDAKAANRTLEDVLQPKSAKEIQSEESIKDNLNSRDLFKTVRNLFGAIKKSAAFLKMSPVQLATVETLTNFNKAFTSKASLILRDMSDRITDDQGNYNKITQVFEHDGVFMDRFQENPLSYLFKRVSVNGQVRGYLDPNILSMMAMHGMEYMATMASSTLYNSDAAVKQLLGLDSKANISNTDMAPFRKIGTSKTELANSIGTKIFNQMGLKGTPQADENFEAQMAMALGLVTIDIMTEMGLLTAPPPLNRSDLDPNFINQNTDKLVALANDGKEIAKKQSAEVVNFVRVATTKKGNLDVVADSVMQLAKNYSLKDGSTEGSISTVLNSLFGIENTKRLPLLKPRKMGKGATYLRSSVPIPDKVRQDLEYAQSIEWRFKPAMVEMLNNLSREEAIKELKKLVGYKDNLDDVADYFKESVQAANDSLLREIEDTLTFFDILAESGQDQFYYSYSSWNNSRSGMNEAAVSPQASKMVRHMMYPTDPSTSEGFAVELSVTDPDHMQMFKVAIIQSLYPDTAIDKNTLEKINSDFEAKFAPNRRNSITKAARSISNGTNPIVAANAAGLEGTISVDGLIALASYYKAVKEGSDTFSTDIAIETDATTSGLIISLLNSGRNSAGALKKLAAGGSYTTTDTNYVNHNKLNPDNYEALSGLWAAKIAISDYMTEIAYAAIKGILGTPERSDAKDPVMQGNYFAANNTLVASYVDSSIDKLYEKLTNVDISVRIKAVEDLNQILQQDYTKLGGKKPFNKFRPIPLGRITDANYKSFALDKFQELKFRVVVSKIYGEPLSAALTEEVSEFAPIGTALNTAGNAAFQVYQAVLNHVTAAVKGNSKQHYLTNKQRALIESDPRIKALFPTMKFVDTGEGQGIHAFKRNSVRNLDSGNRVIIRYSDSKSSKGVKSTSGRITSVQDGEPGVSLVARQIQGIDDAGIRGVLGKFPVMHMFDAIFSPILDVIRNTQEYNSELLDINRDFSIFDNAVDMITKIVDVMEDPKTSDIKAIIQKEMAREESSIGIEDFKALLTELLAMQEDITTSKKKLYEEDIVFFDHMGLPGTGVENQHHGETTDFEVEVQSDTLAIWAEQFLDVDDNWSGPQQKSDSGENISHNNFTHSDSETLSGSNATEIFDTLGAGDRKGNSTDSVEHLEYLRKLLVDLVSPALNSLGDFSLRMRREGNKNAGSIFDKEILLNFGVNNGSNVLLNHGSERTTYVHELVHAITRFMFDDVKLAPIAAEVVKLRERTRRHLTEKYKGEPWKAFLSADEGAPGHTYDKEAEIQYAKSTYAYVFTQSGEFWTAGNDNKVSNAGIHEFVTYGLTDPRLINELKGMPYKAERSAATTFGGRIQEVFLKLVDQIFNRIKKRGTTADSHLIQLVAALNKVDVKSRFNTNKLMRGIKNIDNNIESKFLKYVFTPIAKASFNVAANPKRKGLGRLLARNAATVVGAAVEGEVDSVSLKSGAIVDLKFRKVLDESRKRLRLSKNSLLVYILRTIAGPSNDMDRKVEHMLARTNMLIDQARKNIAEGVLAKLEDSFLNPMEKRDWETLTLGVLKTDLISLLDSDNVESIPKLMDLLRNTNNVRTKRIAEIRTKLLAMGPIGSHYVKQSRGLGILMATGKATVSMQRMNAYMIANSKDVVVPNGMPKDLVAAQKLIDQLASLYALENNVPNANANTAALIEKEFKSDSKENGMISFIGQAINLKKDALARNFSGDETHTVKGFIKNITNPNISVRVAALSEQEEMRSQGYKLVTTLDSDSITDSTTEPRGLYSSDFVTMQDYNRGIMSTTNMKSAGTLLSQILAGTSGEAYNHRSAKNEIKEAVKRNIAEYRKNLNSPDAVSGGNVMVPVFDMHQNIVDFRYMMADDTKVSLLKQDLRAQYILSSEAGSIEDKEKTSVVNKEALQLFKKDLDDNYLKHSDEFVKIGLNSGKAKYRELYSLLPEKTRQDIKKVFGKDEMLIDEKYIDVLFGQRSLSIADLPYMNHRAVKIAEVIWKEIVSMAKKNIVIKTGSVLFYNIISNTVVGILNGVPPGYMLKEQLRTARDLNNYMDAKRSLHAAKAEMASAEGLKRRDAYIAARSKVSELETVLNNSPVRELVKRGLFQSITEEIDSESDPYSYASALSSKIDNIADRNKVLSAVNTGVKAVTRYTFMTDDTSMYKLLLKTTQYSDFVARQAVFKYKTEVEGISADETENLVRDLFVNYDLPDHHILQYMNDTGISMFTKYPMRMLRVIYKMAKGRPLEGISLILLEDFMNINIEDPTDMGLNILNSPFGIVDSAFTQSGLEMAKEVF
jgi:hypothetical protein